MTTPWNREKIRLTYERPEIKASLEIILSIFTVVFLITLAIRPTLSTVASLQKKIEDQAVVDRKLDSKISQLIKITADLQTYSGDLINYDLGVTDNHDQGGLAKRLEVVARQNGLTIGGFTIQGVPLIGGQINLSDKTKGAVRPSLETGGRIASFAISFDISGGANQISDFLNQIENVDRIVVINSVNMKVVEISDTSTLISKTLKATGKAVAYYVYNAK